MTTMESITTMRKVDTSNLAMQSCIIMVTKGVSMHNTILYILLATAHIIGRGVSTGTQP